MRNPILLPVYLVSALVITILGIVLVLPQWRHLKEMKSEVADLKARNTAQEGFLSTYRVFQNEMMRHETYDRKTLLTAPPPYGMNVRERSAALPPPETIPEMAERIRRGARLAGLTLQDSVTGSGPEEAAGDILRLGATGHPVFISVFLQGVLREPFVRYVRRLTITARENGPPLVDMELRLTSPQSGE